MYIVALISLVAFVEIITMLLFRAWEVKRGRIYLEERRTLHRESADRRQQRVMHHLMRILFDNGKRAAQWSLRKFHRTKTEFGAKTGITKMRDLVRGHGEVDSERGSASGYLQDITDHRDSIREEASK
ncbi:MAG: hypothetical protein AAB523_00855 [Patescibacteria group bacterium]